MKYLIALSFMFSFLSIFSQKIELSESIFNSFKDYVELPREITYAHLNKSIYLKGETMAFSIYVFDKYDKKLSHLTTNLYCTISDENDKTIKSKMLLVKDGIANGSFFVDSLFTSGNYTFKAYTNWMKNFDEQNFYIENIKVIDPEIQSHVIPKVISSILDVQFLPEGGHLLANTENTVGIAIKDSLGFGIPCTEGQLLNSKNEALNTFKTNRFGIGKFKFTPKDQDSYKVLFDFEGAKQVFDLDIAESSGITFSLNILYDKIILRIATNKKTLNYIKNRPYKLAIHNGNEVDISEIVFNKNSEILKFIDLNNLSPGVNIFTLFNENNVPLLERLFFKYDGIDLIETRELSYKKVKDSIMVSIPFKDINTNSINKFSVSILPNETISYNHHHNIISYTYLQPYVKGFIENAQYYFTDITRKKQFELNNLLLTQGWSSYNWNNIFNSPPKTNFTFENGVSFKANVNDTKSGRFVLYPSTNNSLDIFEVTENNNTFEKERLVPFDDEKLMLSEIRKNKTVKKSKLYLQFSPFKIPDIEKYTKVLPLKEKVFFNSNTSQSFLETSWTDFEQLDEVVINVNKEKERIKKLKSASFGQVDVFDENKRKSYLDFASYIRTKGFRVFQNSGNLTISSTRHGQGLEPAIYIDDRYLTDFDELIAYGMNFIDYIIIDKSGFSDYYGRGGGGVIKIYTNYGVRTKSSVSIFQEIDYPLTFSAPVKFYTPKYSFYQSQFYKDYGAIDWISDCSVNEDGEVFFKIYDRGNSTNINFYIEGTANDGSFISEVKTLSISN